VPDPDQVFGGAVKLGGAKNVFTCVNTKGCLRQKRLSYAIFQGINTVWKRFILLIQKTFETGPKQWASFLTSCTDLVYLQNVFKRYKSMLRASVCHCFGYP